MNEIVTKSKVSRRRFFKRASRKLLFSDWVRQIFAFIIVGAVFYGVWQFGLALGFSVHEMTSNEELAKIVISVFTVFSAAILVPIAYGLFSFEIKVVSGEKTDLSELFGAFSSTETMFRVYDLFFNLVFRYILYFLPSILLYLFNNFVYPSGIISHSLYFGGIDVVMFLLRTLFVIMLYFGIMFSSKGFLAVYFSVKIKKQTHVCFREAKRCMRGNGSEAVKLAFSFFPLFVVSLFTVGFLFVMYTIPYMFITFIMFAKYLYDKDLYVKNDALNETVTNINEICE